MKFFAPIKLSEHISETPEGFLLCKEVCIARTGEQIYGPGESPVEVGPEGFAVVMREAAEVFRPETMSSFEGKPVTITHPNDFVNPTNWSNLAKGIVQNVRRGKGEQENDMVADLLITDSVAIQLVKNGLREVSCGYNADYVITGVGRGVQKNIIGNHLALVQEGRAGGYYAIHDHKGKGSKMNFKERIAAIFAKAQDEAMKVAAETKDGNMETPEEKKGFVSFDDMKNYFDKAFKDMKDSFGAKQDPQSGKPAEPVAHDEASEEEKKKAKDAEGDVLKQILERLEKLEARESAEEEHPVGDEEGEEGEESEDEEMVQHDDDFEESPMSGETGDAAADLASRVEILAPGMKAKGKGVRAKALVAAYGTKDGKAVIDQFTGGKAPDVKDEKLVAALFIGASELLKAKRSSDLAASRVETRDTFLSNMGQPKGAKTPEDINAINAKHWENRK